MEHSTVRFVAKGKPRVCRSPNLSTLALPDGLKRTPKDLDSFKTQIQRIDGTTIKIPNDYAYVDITIPEGNYYLIRWVPDSGNPKMIPRLDFHLINQLLHKSTVFRHAWTYLAVFRPQICQTVSYIILLQPWIFRGHLFTSFHSCCALIGSNEARTNLLSPL